MLHHIKVDTSENFPNVPLGAQKTIVVGETLSLKWGKYYWIRPKNRLKVLQKAMFVPGLKKSIKIATCRAKIHIIQYAH